jgi:peptidoglycan hydrolase CwlO-like protein
MKKYPSNLCSSFLICVICGIICVILCAGCQNTAKLNQTVKEQANQIDQMKQIDKSTMEMLNGITSQLQTCQTDLEKRDRTIADQAKQIADLTGQIANLTARLKECQESLPKTNIQQGVEELRRMQEQAAQRLKQQQKAAEPNR